MVASKFIKPYVEHGAKADAVRKITVSIPMHVLRLLSDLRTYRQVNNLRHATNSDLLVEAFLHAFTGQPLPTDEELRRTMATAKKTARKSAKKAAKKRVVRKTAAKKRPVAKKATAKKRTVRKTAKKAAKRVGAKKATAKRVAKKAPRKASRKRTAKKAAAAKVMKATKTSKAKK
ncbi:met regulon transcriptional regulator MetJ [Dyella dinghuensis]|uniref:Met repressor n=1 Tax=Dyella dinghuensis TaxID=1920169 RepID=A0A3S0PF80_9GAMM|nr:met regulon transcriptional regulator MetJ [Dyella dinghuensis]RUL64263.1 met regulon transcriptional regulator MetJ [Dyella dinghuensis]